MRRNRLIGMLRIGVPVFGIAVLGVLVAEIIVANMARGISAGGIRISREAVVIDTPEYVGVMANGTRYRISAAAAASAFEDPERVELTSAQVDLMRPDGSSARIAAANAVFSMASQTVDIAGETAISDSRGMEATLSNSSIDWPAQMLFTEDRVEVRFTDGSMLSATSLRYDAGRGIWDFRLVKLTIPQDSEGQ